MASSNKKGSNDPGFILAAIAVAALAGQVDSTLAGLICSGVVAYAIIAERGHRK
jgi:hypothetical protein